MKGLNPNQYDRMMSRDRKCKSEYSLNHTNHSSDKEVRIEERSEFNTAIYHDYSSGSAKSLYWYRIR